MSSCSVTLQERALLAIKAEEADRLAALKALQIAQIQADAERQRLEREARIIAAAERQQALLRAERLEAEQAAASQAAAEQAALDAEIARLRRRTPLEVLQDEMVEMKRLLASRPSSPQRELRVDGELDMRFKSSREELAAARAEIVAMKEQVSSMKSVMVDYFAKSLYGHPSGVTHWHGDTQKVNAKWAGQERSKAQETEKRAAEDNYFARLGVAPHGITRCCGAWHKSDDKFIFNH